MWPAFVNLEAYRGIGLQQAMIVMPVLSVMLALVLYLGSRTMARDVARLNAQQRPANTSGLQHILAER